MVDERERARATEELHDPNLRRFLFVRGPWEVRSPPGTCPLGCAWLVRGLWNLQFFAPLSRLSVLAFQRGAPLEFLARVADGPDLRLDAEELDQYLTLEWGLPPSSRHLAAVVRLMEDKAASSVLRRRAGALVSPDRGERLRNALH
jgi:hypothetical protein